MPLFILLIQIFSCQRSQVHSLTRTSKCLRLIQLVWETLNEAQFGTFHVPELAWKSFDSRSETALQSCCYIIVPESTQQPIWQCVSHMIKSCPDGYIVNLLDFFFPKSIRQPIHFPFWNPHNSNLVRHWTQRWWKGYSHPVSFHGWVNVNLDLSHCSPTPYSSYSTALSVNSTMIFRDSGSLS